MTSNGLNLFASLLDSSPGRWPGGPGPVQGSQSATEENADGKGAFGELLHSVDSAPATASASEEEGWAVVEMPAAPEGESKNDAPAAGGPEESRVDEPALFVPLSDLLAAEGSLQTASGEAASQGAAIEGEGITEGEKGSDGEPSRILPVAEGTGANRGASGNESTATTSTTATTTATATTTTTMTRAATTAATTTEGLISAEQTISATGSTVATDQTGEPGSLPSGTSSSLTAQMPTEAPQSAESANGPVAPTEPVTGEAPFAEFVGTDEQLPLTGEKPIAEFVGADEERPLTTNRAVVTEPIADSGNRTAQTADPVGQVSGTAIDNSVDRESGAARSEAKPATLEAGEAKLPATAGDRAGQETSGREGMSESPRDNRQTRQESNNPIEPIKADRQESVDAAAAGSDKVDKADINREIFRLNPVDGRPVEVETTPTLQATQTMPTTQVRDAASEAQLRSTHPEAWAARENILDKLGNETKWLVRTGRNEAEIHLNPPELGKLTLRLTVTGRAVEGVIEVENSGVRAVLQSELPRLAASLSDSGLDLSQFDVLLADRDKSEERDSFASPNNKKNALNGAEIQEDENDSDEPAEALSTAGGTVVNYLY